MRLEVVEDLCKLLLITFLLPKYKFGLSSIRGDLGTFPQWTSARNSFSAVQGSLHFRPKIYNCFYRISRKIYDCPRYSYLQKVQPTLTVLKQNNALLFVSVSYYSPNHSATL